MMALVIRQRVEVMPKRGLGTSQRGVRQRPIQIRLHRVPEDPVATPPRGPQTLRQDPERRVPGGVGHGSRVGSVPLEEEVEIAGQRVPQKGEQVSVGQQEVPHGPGRMGFTGFGLMARLLWPDPLHQIERASARRSQTPAQDVDHEGTVAFFVTSTHQVSGPASR